MAETDDEFPLSVVIIPCYIALEQAAIPPDKYAFKVIKIERIVIWLRDACHGKVLTWNDTRIFIAHHFFNFHIS